MLRFATSGYAIQPKLTIRTTMQSRDESLHSMSMRVALVVRRHVPRGILDGRVDHRPRRA